MAPLRRIPLSARPAAWLRPAAVCAAALLAQPAGGISELAMEIERIGGEGWELDGLRIRIDLADPAAARLRVAELRFAGHRVTGVSVQCGTLGLGPTITCTGAEIKADAPMIGRQRITGELRWDRLTGALEADLRAPDIAGGSIELSGAWRAGGWDLSATAESLDAASLAALVPGTPLADWSLAGSLGGTVATRSTPEGVASEGELLVSGATFSDPSGLRAGEAAGGRLTWRLTHGDDAHAGQLSARLDSGQLYVDPIFLDLGAAPLEVSTGISIPAALTGAELSEVRIEHSGVLTALGEASLSRESPWLTNARLGHARATLPAAFETWAKPFLLGSGYENLATRGEMTLQAGVAGGSPQSLALSWHGGELARGELALRGIDAELQWTAAGREAAPVSRIDWRGGSLFGIPLGSSGMSLALDARDVVLLAPMELPLLEGTLRVDAFSLRNVAAPDLAGTLDARLRDISLDALSSALEWPTFSGTLEGRLPSLRYEEGVATLGGELSVSAFDGDIRVEDLRLTDPFGQVPVLQTSARLRGLDLERVTRAFSFGRITGRLHGDVEDLRLVDWRPASFRAWFRTPRDDDSRHRISQRAVENLTSLGGGGATGALSRGLLGIFEEFSYDRLGLGCALTGNVCVMRGLEDTENGYVIVRGSGLPRVDVIGFTREVSWPTLVEQLISVTRNREAVIQ